MLYNRKVIEGDVIYNAPECIIGMLYNGEVIKGGGLPNEKYEPIIIILLITKIHETNRKQQSLYID